MATGSTAVKRLRGRLGVQQRKRRLQAEPLCRGCKARGLIVPATTPDHIIPLALGGSDDDSNIQCLCAQCHDLKSAYENASGEAATFHPDWLRPSKIPLEIVCGPPCAGKTTYIAERATEADVVIDLDGIMMKLDPAYSHWRGGLDQSLFNRAVRVRNALLGTLCRRETGKAWLIVSAPSPKERDWWHGKLGGTVTLLHPGVDECKRRAVQRGTPEAAAGVDVWERQAKLPWIPKQKRTPRQAIGFDGWAVS